MDEWKELKPLLDAPLVAGERRFLVSSRWLEQWRKYASSSLAGTAAAPPRPGPIDNADLLLSGGGGGGEEEELRTVFLHFDFETVPARAWERLHAAYGGGPAIKRRVAAQRLSPFASSSSYVPPLEVDVALRKFRVQLASRKQQQAEPVPIFVSRSLTLRRVREKACKKLGVTDPAVVERARMYTGCSFGGRVGSELSKLDETVERSVLVPGQTVIIVDVDDSLAASAASSPSSSFSTSSSFSSLSGSYTFSVPPITSSSCSTTPPSFSSYSSIRPEAPGLCGLSNLGNTCFMAAGIQCLSNTVQLTDHFLGPRWKAEINKKNPLGTGGRLASAYADLIAEMWSGRTTVAVPRALKAEISEFAPQFAGIQQHDCQELLAFLLDGLHEDLNRITDKPYVEQKTPREPLPDEQLAAVYWDLHAKRNSSVIVDLFHGLLKSTVVCPSCGKISITFDPFSFLSLPLVASADVLVRIVLVQQHSARAFGVKVPKSATMSDARSALLSTTAVADTLSGHAQEESIILCAISGSSVVAQFRGDEHVDKLGRSDELFAYVADDPSSVCVPVVMRIPPHSKFSSTHTLFGFPRMVFISKGSTHKDLHGKVLAMLSSHTIGTCSFSVKLANGSPVSARSGHTREIQATSDVVVDVKANEYIVADWDGAKSMSDVERVFDIKHAFEITEDVESLDQQSTDGTRLTLEGCLARFTTAETLTGKDTWYCNRCRKQQEATKKIDLWRLPTVLVIHLKRFSSGRLFREKIDALVDFPTSGFDLTRFVKDPAERSKRAVYDLFAVANHTGSLGGGHYTAIARNAKLNRWYTFDDSMVHEASETQIRSRRNYVLFFQRRK